MRIRRAFIPSTLLLAGAVSLAACGSYGTYGAESAGSSRAGSAKTGTGAIGESATNGSLGRSGGGSTTGGQGQKQDLALPKVTKVDAPRGVVCAPGEPTVDFTVRYSVANAERIEYLRPGADRPGAEDAAGSLTLTFDCSQPQQTFHIRAFNEFADNGSDAKDPSPYVSFPVTRNGKPTSTTALKKTADGKPIAGPGI